MALRIGLAGNIHRQRGGLEKVCCNLATAMVERGHAVTIYSEETCYKRPSYEISPAVRVKRISLSDHYKNIHKIQSEIKSENFDVFASLNSYGYHLFWAVIFLGINVPYIYSEHSSPENVERVWSRAGRLASMSRADAIHQLFPEYKSSLPPFLRDRVVSIPNAAPLVSEATPRRRPTPPYTLLSLGRFHEVKQLPMLIGAFESLAPDFPDWRLVIWGSGDGRDIAKKAVSSPAREQIRFMGPCDDPIQAFNAAHIFCIPSLAEGFPNSVLEAMACGTPVVGFADSPGVRHAIEDGVSGLLAKEMTAEALTNALATAMKDKQLREALGQGGMERARQFTPNVVFDQWERLFSQVAMYKDNTRMNLFTEEPFASMSRLSAAARREWLYRDFGAPWPGTISYYVSLLKRWWFFRKP